MSDGCYRCSSSVRVTDSEIEAEIKRVVASGVPLTNRDEYEKRLKACYACDQLIYATTCMSCGCLVKVRALYALRICPNTSGSRW